MRRPPVRRVLCHDSTVLALHSRASSFCSGLPLVAEGVTPAQAAVAQAVEGFRLRPASISPRPSVPRAPRHPFPQASCNFPGPAAALPRPPPSPDHPAFSSISSPSTTAATSMWREAYLLRLAILQHRGALRS